MTDYKTSRDRLPKHKDDDSLGVTFSVILIVVALACAVFIAETLGLADAFILSFA